MSAKGSTWDANQYNSVAHFVYSSEYVTPVLELLDPRPGERILDLGCGSGEVTLEISRVTEQKEGGVVVGVDSSKSMINKAHLNGLKCAFVDDIQNLRTPNEVSEMQEPFDAVFSNAVLHWCKKDPEGVLKGVKRVLKPGGRLVAEMGGFMNCIGIRATIHRVMRTRGYDAKANDPWYFPSMEDYTKLLLLHGFEPIHVIDTPSNTIAGWFVRLAESLRQTVLSRKHIRR